MWAQVCDKLFILRLLRNILKFFWNFLYVWQVKWSYPTTNTRWLKLAVHTIVFRCVWLSSVYKSMTWVVTNAYPRIPLGMLKEISDYMVRNFYNVYCWGIYAIHNFIHYFSFYNKFIRNKIICVYLNTKIFLHFQVILFMKIS